VSIARAAVLLLLFAAPWLACADTVSTVVDLPSTDGLRTLRILHVRPDAPTGTIIAFAGGSGIYLIQDNGSVPGAIGRCSPQVRNLQAFAERGIATVLVNDLYRMSDVEEIMRQVRSRDAIPTWIASGSASTDYLVGMAARLPAGIPLGVMFGFTGSFHAPTAAQIRRTTVIIHHVSDVGHTGIQLYNSLTAAPYRERVALTGGSDSGCGYHLLEGLDAVYVDTVAGLMDKYRNTLASAPMAGVTAVEFYNASLDHYFVTHVAGEIALLDAGTTTRGWVRTGQSFKVWTSAQAGSSPVCRYYIPPSKGDSHFYGRGAAECDATGAANPTFVNEDPQFFHVMLPVAGVCPAGTRDVYRTFSSRLDANHRYSVDPAIRDQMVGRGWVAEGDGPNLVVMCAPL
jgi:hypothetical protein